MMFLVPLLVGALVGAAVSRDEKGRRSPVCRCGCAREEGDRRFDEPIWYSASCTHCPTPRRIVTDGEWT